MQHLLSSSVDKSVRLWRVGYDNCIRTFLHSDYGALLAFVCFAILYLIVEVLARVDVILLLASHNVLYFT